MEKCISCKTEEGVNDWYITDGEVSYKLSQAKYRLENAFCNSCHRNFSTVQLNHLLLLHYFDTHGVKNDQNKTPWSLLLNEDFTPVLEDVVKILEAGANKYSKDNWKGLETKRLENALLRHVLTYMSGEKLDQETGKAHLIHALTNILFLEWKRNESSSNP